MYFKITNKDENHNGFQYADGLNVLIEKFNDDSNQSCCPGGLYFTNAANIFKFLNYGVYLREITLPVSQGKQSTECTASWPTDNPDFLMIKDKSGDKWRANMIILGKRYDLSNIDTFKYLIESGADVHADDDYALRWSAKNGHLDVIKYLIEKGANVHAGDDYALQWCANNGHLNIIKYLVEYGADIHAVDDAALRFSAINGHLDVIKYLIESGANIHAENDAALRHSARNGHSNVVKYLIEKGADVHADDNYALRYCAKNGELNIIKYLIEKGANAHDDVALRLSAENNHHDVHEFLKSMC